LTKSECQALALLHIPVHASLTIQDLERFCSRVNCRTLQKDLKLIVEKGLGAEKSSSLIDPTKHYVLIGITRK
jgi:hypothetical protein